MRGVWRFEDLVAWKLAVELQNIANRLCERAPVRRDFRFRDQLWDSAASAPRNIAEGFGRFHHPEFARFARIARGSEQEVLNHFYDAHRRGFISDAELAAGEHTARKALKALNGLIRYLDATPQFGRPRE